MSIEFVALIIIPIAFVISFRKSNWVIWGIWLWYLGFSGLTYYLHLPSRIYLIGTAIYFGLLGYSIFKLLASNQTVNKKAKKLFGLILLFFSYMILTNRQGINFVTIKGAFEIIQFPLFAAMIAITNRKISLRFLLNASYILLLTQAIVVFLQWKFFPPPFDPSILRRDTFNGIFGGYGTGSVTPVLISMGGGILAMYIFSKGIKLKYLIGLGLILMPLVIAEGKAGFFGYVLAFILYIIIDGLRKKKYVSTRKMIRVGVASLLLFIFIMIGARAFNKLGYGNISEFFSFNNLIEYFYLNRIGTSYTLTRLNSFSSLLSDMSSKESILLFGHGSGSSLSSTLMKSDPIFWELNKIYGIASRVLNRLLFETGLTGIILMSIIFIISYKYATGFKSRNLKENNIFQITCIKVIFIIFILFCLLNYTMMISNLQIGVFFWMIVGVAMSHHLKNNVKSVTQKTKLHDKSNH